MSKAKRTGDTEAIKAFNELQKYLPQEFGGISKSGKVSDFVVDPLDQTRSLTDQQKNLVRFMKEFLNLLITLK